MSAAATANVAPQFSPEFMAVVESLQQDWDHDDAPEYAAQIHCTPFVRKVTIGEKCPYEFTAATLANGIDFRKAVEEVYS